MNDDLSQRLVDLARELHGEEHLATTAETVTREVVEWVGADAASGITMVRRRGRVENLAATSEVVARGDDLQEDLKEGPCLDAIWEEHQVYAGDLITEVRWPRWAPQIAAEHRVRSMLCTRLFTQSDVLGALNVYSPRRYAFDGELRDEITAFAAHAAIAVADSQTIEGLAIALDRRTIIGTALGIIMERFDLTNEQAFALLRRLSSHSNRKLHDVASEIATTRRMPSD